MAANNQDFLQPPKSFLCPITHGLMVDPVVDDEGNSYERSAITEWLGRDGTSPITRTPMNISNLKANRALKDAIEEFVQRTNFPITQHQASASEGGQGAAAQRSSSAPQSQENQGLEDLGETSVFLNMQTARKVAGGDVYVDIIIEPPEGKSTVPMDIVAIIDTSGSMHEAATVDQGGHQVDVGFSVLDITKHALKTVIESLKPGDRISIVSFSDTAHVVCGMTAITPESKGLVKSLVMNLRPHGCTNLWDGLRVGLNQFGPSDQGNRTPAMLLMTDGVPSQHLLPPRGITESLEKALASMAGTVPTIYTFGFGYNLDTPLLDKIATIGKGCFSFIPDSGFVGTVLVHSIANISTTVGRHANLSLAPKNGAKIKKVFGYKDQDLVSVDTIHFGQEKHIVVLMEVPEGVDSYLSASLSYTAFTGDVVFVPEKDIPLEASEPEVGPLHQPLKENILRLQFVDLAVKMLKNDEDLKTSQAEIKAFIAENQEFAKTPLMKDVEGQAEIAVSKSDYFERWGRNYLFSLMSAHRQQRCNNFKDKSVAVYGGKLFAEQRDRADDLFTNLPPPVPSRSTEDNVDGNISMGAFNNADNPCFHQDSLVHMADGSKKKCSDLVKDDEIMVDERTAQKAKIVCIVRTDCQDNSCSLVTLEGGLKITPWHPVRNPDGGKWVQPDRLGKAQIQTCPSIYSLVLDEHHVVTINGVQCICLGHGFDNPVLEHEYYGTTRVRKDLSTMRGYEGGILHFQHGNIRRGYAGVILGFDEDRLLPVSGPAAVEA